MHIRTTTFWLPKKGNTEKEYEDAAWPLEETDVDTSEFKCAVADGATEASFADIWARLLVKGYAESTPLKDIEKLWQEEIKGLELPWYATEKAESGAFAALIGLELRESSEGDGAWTAKAVGDSCLFHIRDGKLLKAFPLENGEDFNNAPRLLTSKPGDSEDQETMFESLSGSFEKGDVFLLLSDAIAGWALSLKENRTETIDKLLSLAGQEELEELTSALREEKTESGAPRMRNDDVTYLKVEIS